MSVVWMDTPTAVTVASLLCEMESWTVEISQVRKVESWTLELGTSKLNNLTI